MKLIVTLCLAVAAAKASEVTYTSCDTDESGFVNVSVIDVKSKIQFPSVVLTDLEIEALKDFPEDSILTLEIYRIINFFGERHIKIPCIAQTGSCDYDLCKFLADKGPTDLVKFDLCDFFPKDKDCKCPIHPMKLSGRNVPLNFPTLPGLAKFLISGKYAARIIFKYPNKQSYFCLDMVTTLG